MFSNLIKKAIIISIVTVTIFLLVDFLFGKKILSYTFEKKIKNQLENSITLGTQSRNYHHGIKKNLDTTAQYNIFKYKVCTNIFGMRSNCKKIYNEKFYDVMFIGDSFTFGNRLNYEDTFVGLFEKSIDKKVGNLGVQSYSPTLYYLKVKKFIEDGFKFNELIVFVDISDIEDEFIRKEIHRELLNNNLKKDVDENLKSNKQIQNIKDQNQNTKSFIKKIFPLSYRLLFEIKYYNLPQPKYRYLYSYQRSAWTYNPSLKEYDVKFGISKSIQSMNLLYELLKENNIKLSLAIYPYPNTLLYDKKDSHQVKIWKNFCEEKCFKFYNFFDQFYGNKEKLTRKESLKLINKYYLKGDMHFNKLGNLLIYKKLIKNIK